MQFIAFSDCLDLLIEALQEAGTVFLRERGRTAGNRPPFAEQTEDFPARQGFPYSIVRKHASSHVEHDGPFFQAAGRQRNVSRDDDIVRDDACDDPIVGRVEAAVDDHQFEPVGLGNPHDRVRDQRDGVLVSLRNAIDFLLHRTGIGVDEDLRHAALSCSEPAELAVVWDATGERIRAGNRPPNSPGAWPQKHSRQQKDPLAGGAGTWRGLWSGCPDSV
jgi:hypothetical protein